MRILFLLVIFGILAILASAQREGHQDKGVKEHKGIRPPRAGGEHHRKARSAENEDEEEHNIEKRETEANTTRPEHRGRGGKGPEGKEHKRSHFGGRFGGRGGPRKGEPHRGAHHSTAAPNE